MKAMFSMIICVLVMITSTALAQQETRSIPTACAEISINRTLRQGMSGEDVRCMQAILNTDPDTQISESGPGSPGNETIHFRSLTQDAVIRFQQKYASEILTPMRLTQGTGVVYSTTRAKLNSLMFPDTPTAQVDRVVPQSTIVEDSLRGVLSLLERELARLGGRLNVSEDQLNTAEGERERLQRIVGPTTQTDLRRDVNLSRQDLQMAAGRDSLTTENAENLRQTLNHIEQVTKNIALLEALQARQVALDDTTSREGEVLSKLAVLGAENKREGEYVHDLSALEGQEARKRNLRRQVQNTQHRRAKRYMPLDLWLGGGFAFKPNASPSSEDTSQNIAPSWLLEAGAAFRPMLLAEFGVGATYYLDNNTGSNWMGTAFIPIGRILPKWDELRTWIEVSLEIKNPENRKRIWGIGLTMDFVPLNWAISFRVMPEAKRPVQLMISCTLL